MIPVTEILIVDDDPALLQATSHALEFAGYVVTKAECGQEALRLVRERRPALALLDMDLPDMSGMEVCRQIKYEFLPGEVMVAILTGSHILEESRVQGLEGGADDYITRPVSNRELLARVHSLLRMHTLQQETRRAAEQWHATFDAVGDVILLTDASFTILRCNRAALPILGVSPAEMIGKKCFEIIHNTPEPTAVCPFNEARHTQSRHSAVFQSGERWLEVTVDPVFDPGGEFTGTVHVVKDVTASRLAHEDLQDRERKLKESQKLGRIGNWEFTLQDQTIAWSDETYELYERDLKLGPPTPQEEAAYYSPEQAQILREYARLAIQTRKQQEYDLEALLPSGRRAYFHANMQPVFNAQGQAVKLFGTVQDITERKQMEQEMLNRAEQLQAVNRLGRALSETLDPASIYAMLGDAIQQFLPDISTVFISQYDAASEMMTCVYASVDGKCLDTKELPPLPLEAPGVGTQSEAIRTRRPLIINNLRERLKKIKNAVDVTGNDDERYTQSGLYVPMLAKEQVIGVIQVQSFTLDRFTNEDAEMLNLVANTAAVALENARLYHAVQEELEERKRAEERLRESEDKFKYIFDHSVIGKSITSIDGKIHVNQAFCEMLGYSIEELQSRNWHEITHPDDLALSEAETEALLSGHKEKTRFTKRYLHKNGSTIWAEVGVALRRDAEGRPLYFLTSINDITERKKAEMALQESEHLYCTLNQNSPLGMHFYHLGPGDELIFMDANPAADQLLGIEHSTLIGKTIESAFPALAQTEIPDRYRAAAKGTLWVTEDVSYSDGRICGVFNVRAVPTTPGNMVAVFEDITLRKQAEEKIRQINAELERRVEERTRELSEAQEQLVRHKTLSVLGQLAGSVGHELRNPLAVITSAIYYLKLIQPETDQKVKDYLTIIERETVRAEKIITDLLDFARIKNLDPEPASVFEVVERTLARYPAPENVSVSLRFPPNLPAAYADARHMEQVFGNLIVNAFQAMPQGGQLTVAGASENKDGKFFLRVDVADSGVGIPPENMDKLFEPLFTTKARGIGLGLAVCQKLVQANGGCIEVQSEPGKGSVFTVWLPVCMGGAS